MSWAEMIRQRSPPPNDMMRVCGAQEDGTSRPQQKSQWLLLPADVWSHVLEFLSQDELCLSLALTCRFLWSLHRMDHVWRVYAVQLHAQMCAVYGFTKIADRAIDRYMILPTFRSFRLLHKWFVADVHRTHALNDEVLSSYNHRSPFRLVLRMLDSTPTSRRIPISMLNILQVTDRRDSVLSVRFLATLCDNVRAGLQGKTPYTDCTEVESQAWISSLLLSLSPENAGDNLLHNLGPRVSLVEINMLECQSIASEMHASRLLTRFVIDPPNTRYFTGPELIREELLGFVAVDDYRLIAVQQRT